MVYSQLSTLNPNPSTLNSNLSTLTPHPSTLNPQPSTLISQLSTLNPQPYFFISSQSAEYEGFASVSMRAASSFSLGKPLL